MMGDTGQTPSFSEWPLRYVARITLMLRLPLAIHSGGESEMPARDFARDANGLPALPGTSICGILRHGCKENGMVQADVDALFGASADKEGTASRLSVTWGHIHDSVDRPVDGLLPPGDPRFDCPVLTEARAGGMRQHIRVNAFGASDGRGKFEEAVVCAGHRFTFDLMLRGDEQDQSSWEVLLDLLHDADLRLGAGSRRGFGAFRVHRLLTGTFDLRRREEFRAFCGLPKRLDEPIALNAVERQGKTRARRIGVTLRGLHPTTPWMFGGGAPEAGESIAPVTETVIRWQDDHGTPTAHRLHYVPASGVKGALAHRVAWHFNRFSKRRVKEGETFARVAPNEGVISLFGHMSGARGKRGLLLFDDLVLNEPAASQEIHHVSLDRFTGGARNGLLFSERVLAAAAMHTDYRIVVVPAGGEPVSENVRKALGAALEDIRKGRLAFGSGAARGNGRFRCDSVMWDDDGHWLATGTILGREAGV